MEVSTEEVSDDSAEETSGVWPGGSSPKVEKSDGGGGPGLGPWGPGLDDGGCEEVRGVRSRAPSEPDSDGEGLSGGCRDDGRCGRGY